MEIIGDKDKLIGLNFRAKEGYSGRIANENFFTFFRDTKIILNNDFIEKFKEKKIIINCETKKEATKFCNFLHYNDFKWANGESLKDDSWTPFYPNIGFISDKNLCVNSTIIDDYFEDMSWCILKFKDCIIENDEIDYFDTEDFKEFVEYWKKGNTYIKFNNIEDKKKFTKLFDDYCQDSISTDDYFVAWSTDINEWVHATKRRKNFPLILFKDIKNWREILKLNKDESTKSYKFKNYSTITINDILKYKPCSEEFDKFIEELIEDGFSITKLLNNEVDFTIEELLKYKTVQDNINWAIEKDIIVEENTFESFEFKININSKEELATLRDILEYNMNSESDYLRSIWDLLSKEMYRIKD